MRLLLPELVSGLRLLAMTPFVSSPLMGEGRVRVCHCEPCPEQSEGTREAILLLVTK